MPVPRTAPDARHAQGQTLEVWLAFAFGVIFVSVMLYLAAVTKNPEPFAIKIYLTVMALAAAGVGAVLPGFMEVKYKTIFRAGGSLALFALVYLNAPAIGSTVVRIVVPDKDPLPVMKAFFDALDSGNPVDSWRLLPASGRAQVGNDLANWKELYKNVRAPLGKAIDRTLIGEALASTPIPGVPIGAYRGNTYKTKFTGDPEPRLEAIVVRANEREEWEVFSYQLSLQAK